MATQSNKNYKLSGRITDRDDAPLEGMTVRAYDQDPKTPVNPLGKEAVTDADGRYTSPYDALPSLDSINLRVAVMDANGDPFTRGFVQIFSQGPNDEQIIGKSPLTAEDALICKFDVCQGLDN